MTAEETLKSKSEPLEEISQRLDSFTHLDLFSGIGGFALAAKSIWKERYKNIGFCEIDKFCHKVLRKNFGNDIRIFEDIRNLRKEEVIGTVDILTGGFPCQPFSVAGNQRAKDDERYLWDEMFRVIRENKPRWIIGENVSGLIQLALDDVISSLETFGYTTESFVIPASAGGFKHRRDRVWIIAHTNSTCNHKYVEFSGAQSLWEQYEGLWSPRRSKLELDFGELAPSKWRGEGESFARPLLLRNDDGLSTGLDKHRLKALGNAIVPQIAMVLLAAIKAIDDQTRNEKRRTG